MATLTLNFTSDNNPTNGYIVYYRKQGDAAYTKLSPTPYGSPIQIPNVVGGYVYEGTIQADCGNGQVGSLSSFSASIAAKFYTARDASVASNACANNSRNTIFYASSAVLTINQQLYTDEAMQNQWVTAGYYSDGTKVYTVGSDGKVSAIANCQIV